MRVAPTIVRHAPSAALDVVHLLAADLLARLDDADVDVDVRGDGNVDRVRATRDALVAARVFARWRVHRFVEQVCISLSIVR